jgi:hypothetical protein
MTECCVCKTFRFDGDIKVLVRDLSRSKGMPVGTYTQEIKYCGDKADCAAGAVKYPVPKSFERSRA